MVALPKYFDPATVQPLRLVTLTLGRGKTETRWTERLQLSTDELAEELSRAELGPKDGRCYV